MPSSTIKMSTCETHLTRPEALAPPTLMKVIAMKRNENTTHSDFTPESLLRTKVRRSPAGIVPAGRTIGFVETLPRAIPAKEFRKILKSLEEKFQPVTIDDVALTVRMAELICQRYYVPAAIIGPNDPNCPSERMKKLPSEIQDLKSDINRYNIAFELLRLALQKLPKGANLSECRENISVAVNRWLDKVGRNVLPKEEQPNEPFGQTIYVREMIHLDEGLANDAHEETRKPIWPDGWDTGVLDYEQTVGILTSERIHVVKMLNGLKELLASSKKALRKLKRRVEKEPLSRDQEIRVDDFRRAGEREMRHIERTLTARRKNSYGSRRSVGEMRTG